MQPNSHFIGEYDPIGKAIALIPSRSHLHALDVGAGKGYTSKKLADYGFMVDAVDPQLRKQFQRDPANDHQNVTFTCTRIEDYSLHKQYDLIALLNVIMFLDRDYVVQDLLPCLSSNLSSGGVLCLAYIVALGGTEQKITHQNWFAEKELKNALYDLKCVDAVDFTTVQQDHPKHGFVSFYSRCLTFQKN
ncbi:MAG: methyltransferase domain-containing protein [Candidatus Absconditabacterales bacterium]